MNLQLLSLLQPYKALFNVISGGVTAIVTFAAFFSLANQARGQLKMRTRGSWLILASGLIATALVVSGICVGIVPAFAILSNRVVVGNELAIGGLVIAICGWLVALGISARNRRLVWLGSLLVFGVVIYGGAIIYSDFVSYLAVGLLPTLFGFAGPQSP